MRNSGRAKCIGFDDVRTGSKVLAVDLADDVWACQAEQLVIAFDINVVLRETCTTVVGFTQFILLNHRAHCTIKDDDALLQNLGEVVGAGVMHDVTCVGVNLLLYQICCH